MHAEKSVAEHQLDDALPAHNSKLDGVITVGLRGFDMSYVAICGVCPCRLSLPAPHITEVVTMIGGDSTNEVEKRDVQRHVAI